jgi:hypothetical protein
LCTSPGIPTDLLAENKEKNRVIPCSEGKNHRLVKQKQWPGELLTIVQGILLMLVLVYVQGGLSLNPGG